MDAKYFPKDVKTAKEQEFLRLKQGNVGVMEYATAFNELSYLPSTQVAIEEMKMDHFKQALGGSVKQMVAGHAYATFWKTYHRAMKIARVMDQIDVGNRELSHIKRKFGSSVTSF